MRNKQKWFVVRDKRVVSGPHASKAQALAQAVEGDRVFSASALKLQPVQESAGGDER